MTNLTETKQKIRTDDSFVLTEIARLKQLLALKREFRFDINRVEAVQSESVAEHVYGMYILATYFMPLELPEGDYAKVLEMILWHDIDEVITGDKIGYLKTDADKVAAEEAQQTLLDHMPSHLRSKAEPALTEYEARQTPESQFVKAIDKIESSIHMFTNNGREIIKLSQATLEQHHSIKKPYFVNYPYISRFYQVITTEMVQAGFFDY